jgi:hypothetical protein
VRSAPSQLRTAVVGAVLVALLVLLATAAGAREQPGVLPSPVPPPPMSISSTRLHLDRHFRIPVRIGCPPLGSDCTAKLRLESSSALGKAISQTTSFTAPAGRRIVVRLGLNHSGRAMLGQRDIRVNVVIFDFNEGARLTGYRSLSLR